MAMTVSEAAAVNDLFEWLTGQRAYEPKGVTDEQATDALRKLVAGAHKRLGAGVWPEKVPALSRLTVARAGGAILVSAEVRDAIAVVAAEMAGPRDVDLVETWLGAVRDG